MLISKNAIQNRWPFSARVEVKTSVILTFLDDKDEQKIIRATITYASSQWKDSFVHCSKFERQISSLWHTIHLYWLFEYSSWPFMVFVVIYIFFGFQALVGASLRVHSRVYANDQRHRLHSCGHNATFCSKYVFCSLTATIIWICWDSFICIQVLLWVRTGHLSIWCYLLFSQTRSQASHIFVPYYD